MVLVARNDCRIYLRDLLGWKPRHVIDLSEMVKNDPDDNKFIESAAEGGAEFIVSGYKHLLKIKKYS